MGSDLYILNGRTDDVLQDVLHLLSQVFQKCSMKRIISKCKRSRITALLLEVLYFMRMTRSMFVFLILFISGCALLGRPSFERDITINHGQLKKYVLTLKGEVPNMIHDESQLYWPTYSHVIYKIHVDELSGVITEDNFKITYGDNLDALNTYSGTLTFKDDNVIIDLRNCPHPDNCFKAEFNGSYKLKGKI